MIVEMTERFVHTFINGVKCWLNQLNSEIVKAPKKITIVEVFDGLI
jgi:hypothetical protein